MTWRKIVRNATVAFAFAATLGGPADASGPRTLLFYGNSFTRGYGSAEAESYGGVPEVVKQLAIAAGYPEPRVENAAVNNQSLAWHLANNTSVITDPADFQEVPDFRWDAVVMQEFSTKPTHIGDPAGFRADAVALLAAVRSHSPAARAVLYETWARAPGHEFYAGDPPLFPGGPAQMQQELRENYTLARQDLLAVHGPDSAIVARVGDAWEATGWNDLFADDLWHANTRGTYLAGLIIFATVYGQPTTVGLPGLFPSLTQQDALYLQRVADAFLPPGVRRDLNGDGDVDQDDIAVFVVCATGPGVPYRPADLPEPPPGCPLTPDIRGIIAADLDLDGDVDQTDFGLLQANLSRRPPSLQFERWDLTFHLPQGTGTDSGSNTVSTTDASMPSVGLSAVDIVTQNPPAWLMVPASVNAATPFAVAVNVTGLPAGWHYARIYGSAAGYESASFTVRLNLTPAVPPQTLLFDFGIHSQQTAGNWNNVTDQQGSIAGVVDSQGNSTGISLTVTDAFWPGANTNGTTAPTGDAAIFDVQATRDSLFGNTVEFGGSTEPTAGFTLAGLSTDPGATYTFTFFASRMGASENRETAYGVAGANSGTAYLNPADNQDAVAVVSGIAPAANGTITVTLGPGPNNINPYGFYYLGAMRVVRNAP